MPTTKTTTKTVRRKPAAKRAAKGPAKKRSPRKATSRVKKATIVADSLTIVPFTELPKEPRPEPISDKPMMDETTEVAPIVAEPHFSTLSSRVSFYLGVVTGAAVMHVLVFALVAIMNS